MPKFNPVRAKKASRIGAVWVRVRRVDFARKRRHFEGMDNKAKSRSPSAVLGGNSKGGAEKELGQKEQKHRERARAYYALNKAHVLEKARVRYRRKRESQKKAEEQKGAERQNMEGTIGVNKSIQKGVERAEALKRYEGPPLLRILEFVADKLAAQQAKAESAPSAVQGAEDSESQAVPWGLSVARPAPSRQSEYERYLREREWRPPSLPPPPPRPGYTNYDIGYGRIMQVRDQQEPPAK